MTKFNNGFDEAGIEIFHHFGSGMYVKECRIPAGRKLTQHTHKFDHLSWLSKGQAVVEVNGAGEVYSAPCMLKIKANKVHSVLSVTDVVWLCMHGTDETDVTKIDESLV